MRAALRDRMAREIKNWAHVGLIDDPLAERLAQRYEVADGRHRLLLKWLGFFAIFWLGSAVLSMVGLAVSSVSPFLGGVVLGGAAAAMWTMGSRMASDPAQKHPFTGSVLITVGLAAGYGALSVLYLASGGSKYSDVFPFFMILTSVAAFATAYQYRLRWPLLLALVLLFHGVGSWHGYAGHGWYVLAIQDERIMAVVALLTVGFGHWHEHGLEASRLRRHLGFGSLYLITGLLYLNLSLWILSLPRAELGWVLVFTAAGIAQLVAGARLKDSRWSGFGIVFLSIDLYTRFFEHFWDHLSAATFFMAAGVVGMALGYVFERLGQGRQAEVLEMGGQA